MTPFEQERYQRHLVLPEIGASGQTRLRAARVAIIGVGGLGAPVAQYLVAAGVGTIGLFDFDSIDRSNLQRQVLFRDADVGLSKVRVAAERLRSQNPDCQVTEHPVRIQASNAAALLADYDFIVDGSDNLATRYAVNAVCVAERKPYIYASIFRFEGQVSVFVAKDGPCYRCLFPIPPKQPPQSCEEAGVLGVLPAVIGALQGTETIKVILELGTSLAGRLLLYSALDMTFQEVRFNRDPHCPECSPSAKSPSIDVPTCDTRRPISVPLVSATEYLALRQNRTPHVLLDVRRANEREINAIEGSVHIPLDSLSQRANELVRDDMIIIHCQSGGRSATAASTLIDLGFTNVWSLEGGIKALSLPL